MHQLPLTFTRPGGWVCLRELCGRAEGVVEGTSTADALRLLDQLLVDLPGASLGPGQAARLTAPDRDRLLAWVYGAHFGFRVESTLRCGSCGEPFDLDFDLGALLDSLEGAQASAVAQGSFALPDGRRFRLPTGEDEIAVASLAPERAEVELARRCGLAEPAGEAGAEDEEPPSPPEGLLAALEAHLAAHAPLVDCELEATCPECDAGQTVHFDIQHYLLSALSRERRKLSAEIHRLASSYGWGLDDILSLPRSRRRELVELVEAELAAAREVAW